MTNTPTPVSEELLAKARSLTQARFAAAPVSDLPEGLLELSAERLAQRLAKDPKLGEASEPKQAPEPNIDFSAKKRSLLDIKPPPLPQIYLELTKVVNDPYKTSRDAAEMIGKDPGLTSYLLRLVNSPLYGLRDKVETISRAVSVVGMLQLHTLAMGRAASSMFDAMPRKDLLDMNLFWRHSISCAILSRSLGIMSGSSDMEELFVAGLLHDMGKLLLAVAEPDLTALAEYKASTQKLTGSQAEKSVFGFTHADLGGIVLGKWNLSNNLADAVSQHHAGAESELTPRAALVHLADYLSHALSPLRGTGLMPELDLRALSLVALSPEKLQQAAEELDNQLLPLLEVFKVN